MVSVCERDRQKAIKKEYHRCRESVYVSEKEFLGIRPFFRLCSNKAQCVCSCCDCVSVGWDGAFATVLTM